jgi:NAD-dependent dihydropyrimidine dehydrogenase PreA subunit
MHHHNSTQYIELNTRVCQACWKCVETCPNHVLGKIDIFFHKHARVDNADACKGCKKCVRVCPNGAILYKGVNSVQKSDEEKAISYRL